MFIEDGTGSGKRAAVNDDNLLKVFSIGINYLEELNEQGRVWSVPLDAIAPSGATKFFYLTYTGTKRLGISHIHFASSVAGVFRFLKVTGSPTGGTSIVATPLRFDSPIAPVATILSGASITGLTDAGLIVPFYLQANVMVEANLDCRWYIAPNTALAIQAPASAIINGHIDIFEEPSE